MSQQPEPPDKLQQVGAAAGQLGSALMKLGCALTVLFVIGMFLWGLIFGQKAGP